MGGGVAAVLLGEAGLEKLTRRRGEHRNLVPSRQRATGQINRNEIQGLVVLRTPVYSLPP